MVDSSRQVGEAHDVGPDDYLDYDPEPYERALIAAWADYRFIKPTDEELDRAVSRFGEVSKRIDDLLALKGLPSKSKIN
jgi:hypothetical protein